MSAITEHMVDILINKYGPFLSINQLADALDRSPEGLRITLLRDSEVSRQFQSARSKIGRRVYFNAVSVAEIMTADAPKN
jgi:hypothetical protein